MNKREVIIQLLQFIVISPPRYFNFAVMFSSNEERKEFINEFYSTLDTIPEWLLPQQIRRQSRVFETYCSTIYFVTSTWELKGLSINFFYYSNKISGKTKENLMEDLYPVFSAMKVAMTEFE